MKTWWWKALSVLLLLGVAIVGLRTPLAPALVACTPDRVSSGPLNATATGYGTRFTEGLTGAWIVNGGRHICAAELRAVDDAHLEARFAVGGDLAPGLSDLVVRTTAHGDLVFPGAFYALAPTDSLPPQFCPAPAPVQPAEAFLFPDRNILNESIRNLFFHVPMWFAMIAVMAVGVWNSLRVLGGRDALADDRALAAVQVGLLFGLLGLVTGSLWARVTWGTWWTNDAKLNGAAVGVLTYLAYLVLRGSVNEERKRARLAAIYSIFAFTFMLLFFFVLPRLNAVDSLHPGNGGNPAFNTYDLDSRLRLVFYPACIGWIGLAIWMYQLRHRLLALAHLQPHATDA